MNKKNITYCSLAILTIAIIAMTANQATTTTNSAGKNSMAIKTSMEKEQAQPKESFSNINKSKNEAQKVDANKAIKAKNNKTIFADSDNYSKTELNRALMYQKKSWAKDDTINESAWDAAQNTVAPDIKIAKESKSNNIDVAKNSKPVIEKQQKPTPVLNTKKTQDSKDNSAMVD